MTVERIEKKTSFEMHSRTKKGAQKKSAFAQVNVKKSWYGGDTEFGRADARV